MSNFAARRRERKGGTARADEQPPPVAAGVAGLFRNDHGSTDLFFFYVISAVVDTRRPSLPLVQFFFTPISIRKPQGWLLCVCVSAVGRKDGCVLGIPSHVSGYGSRFAMRLHVDGFCRMEAVKNHHGSRPWWFPPTMLLLLSPSTPPAHATRWMA